METNQPCNRRLAVLDKDGTEQTTEDQLQEDCQAWPCCFCTQPLPLSIKVLAPCLSGVGGGPASGQMSALLPPSGDDIQNKANFPFHQPGLLAFERQAACSFSYKGKLQATLCQSL